MFKRGLYVLAVLLLLTVFSLPAHANGITILVVPSLAPNGWGSANFAAYQANAITALINGLSSYGNPGLPSYYSKLPNAIPASWNTVTSFPSWLGKADPGTAFGAAFAGELGNRVHFGVHIMGNGTQFSISQMSFVASSSDPYDALGFSYAGGYGYSSGYVGLNYGPDGIKGTADDFWVTGGPATQLVDELFGRGSGNALWPCMGSVCSTIAEQQAAINSTALYFTVPTNFTGRYTITLANGQSYAGSGTVVLTPIPEPGTLALLGTGLVGLAGALRRKFARKE